MGIKNKIAKKLIFQILFRNATLYLNYLRIIDSKACRYLVCDTLLYCFQNLGRRFSAEFFDKCKIGMFKKKCLSVLLGAAFESVECFFAFKRGIDYKTFNQGITLHVILG